MAWARERDFPFFVQSTGPYAKMGLDNPDTLYFHSYVRDDSEYLVTGQRGTTRDISFQVLGGDYSPVEVPDSLTVFDDRAIRVDDDGCYEIRFGPGLPGDNRFTLGPGSAMLVVREVYSDWATEQRGTIRIRRVGSAGRVPAPASAWTSTAANTTLKGTAMRDDVGTVEDLEQSATRVTGLDDFGDRTTGRGSGCCSTPTTATPPSPRSDGR